MVKRKLDGGDLLVKCLLNEGVKYIFGITGGELLRIYDAIYRFGRDEGINTIMVRHEQAGTHAADAYARATGDIGVCMGTVGPGVMHLVPAVASAWADSIPLLVIGAQVGKMFDNKGIIQGCIDQGAVMKPITKMQIYVEKPDEIPNAVQKAFKEALSGRKGPVYLEFRETALVRIASEENLQKIQDPNQYRPKIHNMAKAEDINGVVDLLKNAENPLIIAGGGVIASEASEELIKLSTNYMLPTATTVNGIGSISRDKKTYVGSLFTVNAYRTAAAKADLILSLGCKWDYTVLFGDTPFWNKNQKIIQVDVDPKEIGKNRPVEIGIVADAKTVLNQLLVKMEKSLPKEKITQWSEWNDFLQEYYKDDLKQNNLLLNSEKIPIRPQRLVLEIYNFFPPETIYTIDGGDIMAFSHQYISYFPRFPRSYLYPTAMGHLGVGLPYAIGAKLAKPDNPVVAITGDGAFMFSAQELDTAVRYDLPIICIISNNSCWGMIKGNQDINYDKRFCDTDLPPTDFAEIAKSYGCYAERVINPGDLRGAFQRAMDSEKPSVIDVEVAHEITASRKLFDLYKKSKGLYG
ncbi:MAG: thiamine pyrophosphate-binding protein [Promethearchaeota archaeon]|nr:MAG: thiamine pyrophosphate-binding protein [Candidatus Lokiarchaeota archaeon]